MNILSTAFSFLNVSVAPKIEVKKPEDSLTYNLIIADRVVRYVKSTVPFAANNYDRCQFQHQMFTVEEKRDRFRSVLSTLHCIRELTPKPPEKNWWLKTAKITEKYGVGNCQEMAAVAFTYAKKKFPDKKVEIISIDQGNHVFVVIDRDEKTDINDFMHWGPDAVICDPWSESVYPASKILTHLKTALRTDKVNADGKWNPPLEPFNPILHSFKILSLHADRHILNNDFIDDLDLF